MNDNKSQGTTPSERYLSYLCRNSFLSLWSYPNLYTDKGKKGRKGFGKELCDLLVIFGNDVIIFSDKYIEFNESIDTVVAWKRWYKKAVLGSARQLYGAENWLRKYKERIFLDPQCTKKLPINIPEPEKIQIHRVAVALGVYEACKNYFGGNSLGSLIVNSALVAEQHFDIPFNVGHVNPLKGFIHVFEDFTLNAVLRELDTISDFIAYLSKKEKFLSQNKAIIVAPGEEQLLSVYLTKINQEGEHDFVIPGDGDANGIWFDESFWDEMVQNPQYLAKKKADKISYAWDRLIEHFIKYGGIFNDSGKRYQNVSDLERALRLVASEPRVRRRQLAEALVNLLGKTPHDKRATRVVYSNDFPQNTYVFLLLPRLDSEEYEEYRENRKALLVAYCKVAKLRCPDTSYIIGIATENSGATKTSEDLVALDVRNWTSEMQKEAEQIRKEASLLLESNVSVQERRTSEYPDVAIPTEIPHTQKSKKDIKKKKRRRMQKLSRRRSRKNK